MYLPAYGASQLQKKFLVESKKVTVSLYIFGQIRQNVFGKCNCKREKWARKKVQLIPKLRKEATQISALPYKKYRLT